MKEWLIAKYDEFVGLAGLIAAALIVLLFSHNTPVFHFAAGLVAATIGLFVLTVLFEFLWRAVAIALKSIGIENND